MIYDMRAHSGSSRGPGLATVIALHVALGAALLSIKQPASELINRAPLAVSLLPDITRPTEPLPLPVTPEDLSLTEPLAQETFQLPEILQVSEIPTDMPATSEPLPTSSSLPTRTRDVRRSAALPSRLEKPPYPRASEILNEEGISTIEACISPRGTVTSSRLIATSGFSRLDDAAVAWVKKVRNFKSATLNGKPVAECITIPVEWKIETR